MKEYDQVICPRCGTKSEVKCWPGYTKRGGAGASEECIETEIPIRCPHCLMRLNGSAEEFSGRIERRR